MGFNHAWDVKLSWPYTVIVSGDLKQMSKSKVQRKKTVRAQPPHKCSCCGKVVHNIKQCPSPAAKELLHLRAAVKGFLEGAPLCRVITLYSKSRLMEAPSVADAQSQLKLARTAVEHIYQALQAAEAKAGEAMCTNLNQSWKH